MTPSQAEQLYAVHRRALVAQGIANASNGLN
jgi:hypothetical protein